MTLSYFLVLFACSLVFGGIIGAYFGTAEYRIRNDLPLITGQCYCPACHHSLAALQQIPIVSWLALGGRCHYCKAPIPWRYPLVEAGFLICYGLLFLILWRHPVLMLCSWFVFVYTALLLRCRGHIRSLLKGLAIFAGYHSAYGTVVLCIYAALQLL